MSHAAEHLHTLENAVVSAPDDCARVHALNALLWELRTLDTGRALLLSEEAMRLARASKDPALLAPSLCLRGACASILSQHQEAMTFLQESLTFSRQTGDRFTEARCLQTLGYAFCCLGHYRDGAKMAMASIEIREDIQDWQGLGFSCNLLGAACVWLSDYSQALHWYTRSMEAWEHVGDKQGITQSLSNLGSVYAEMNDDVQALVFYRRSLEHARRTYDFAMEQIILCNLADAYIGLKRYEEALEVSHRAMEKSETRQDNIAALSLCSIGLCKANMQQPEAALDCFAHSIELARLLQDRDMLAVFLCHMGSTLTRCGRLEEARACLAEAAALAHALGARKTAFLAAEGLSEVCKRLGDYAAALGHHETFRRLEREVFSEEADKRAQAVAIGMEVEYHRREAQALSAANAALETSNAALQNANAQLEALATTDPLTGLPNHRAMVAALDAEMERAHRYGRPFSVLFLDIDHFKAINDGLGHAAGDAALREFAAVVRGSLRGVDTLGRWGGEEFVALLPETDSEGALSAAEAARAAVAAHCVAACGGTRLTCSVGVAAHPLHFAPEHGGERDALVEGADRAMYAAKHLGRNQVRCADDPAVAALLREADAGTSREQQALSGTIEALAALVDARQTAAGASAERVAALSVELAQEMGLPGAEARLMGQAARLHNIGKIAVSDAVLCKPGRLNAEEWAVIKRHPVVGADVVSLVPGLRALAGIIYSHHEHWNGTGYPEGLAGDAIPLPARILSVVAAFVSMTAEHPYRQARSEAAALDELHRCAGTQFDPDVVRAFARMHPQELCAA